ncbi:MAG: hypothetical protein ACFB01_15895 [Cohaesibacteraceae bacterium]
MVGKATKSAFYIAPIGPDRSEARQRSDIVLKHIVRPVLSDAGYRVVRADELNEPGNITNQVLKRLFSDELFIADLTDRNPNVFYELAVRHSARKPVITIVQSGQPIPFDIAQERAIFIDHRDLDQVERAKLQIQNSIEHIESEGYECKNPLSDFVKDPIIFENNDDFQSAVISMLEDIDFRTSIGGVEVSTHSIDAASSSDFDHIEKLLYDIIGILASKKRSED